MGTRRGGFSLVELLVVIGIVGVLVAILLPTLSKARQSGYRVSCRAQLRDIGNQLQMYLNDSKGRLPLVYSVKYKALPTGATVSLAEALKTYAGNSTKIYECPQDAILKPDIAGGMPAGAARWAEFEDASYQFNTMLMQRVADSGGTLTLAKAVGDRDAKQFNLINDIEPFHNAATKAGSTNYLFADWHVSDRTD